MCDNDWLRMFGTVGSLDDLYTGSTCRWRCLKTFNRKCWDIFSPFWRHQLIDQLRVGFEPAENESAVHEHEPLTQVQWTMNSNRQAPLRRFHATSKSSLVAQNRMWQPLVAQVTRLPCLRKGDSLKVGQPAPLSSRMIGQPLFHWRTLAHKALLLPPAIKGESRESSWDF